MTKIKFLDNIGLNQLTIIVYLEKNSEIVIATQNIANASQEAAERTKELNDSLLQITENAEPNIYSPP